MKPIIPWKTLNALYEVARLPTKSMPAAELLPIWLAVARMKSRLYAEKGKPRSHGWPGAEEPDWESIKAILDDAMNDRSSEAFEAFEAFAEAWQKTGTPSVVEDVTFFHPHKDRDDVTLRVWDSPDNKPRQPLTASILDGICEIQRAKHRSPTRQELLDWLGKRAVYVDDTELCRQLKRMSLQDLFNSEKETS
jgi:hypothetical protein